MEIVQSDVTTTLEVHRIRSHDGVVPDPEDGGHVLSIDGQAREDDGEEAEAKFEMWSFGIQLIVNPTISCPVKRIDSQNTCFVIGYL